jgi:SAM-dependent methyltransferase
MDAHPATVITTLINTLAPGARVLDLGAGAGTFPYASYPALRTTAVELRPRPGSDAIRSGRLVCATSDRLPFRSAIFDLVIAHWLFEHVDELDRTYDEVARVVRPGGLLAVAVPNSHSFEDRFYRFVSHVYKYALLHFKKRIEHVQVLTFLSVNQALYARGFRLVRFGVEAGGYCWLEVPQLRPFKPAILTFLHGLKRLGWDPFRGANYRLLFERVAEAGPGGTYLTAAGSRSANG